MESDKKRILIIDDDPDITITVSEVLEQNGFKTDSYNDPILAFENFRRGQYDLVILDIKMSDDGFHLYQMIKRIDSRIKICFLTATEFFHEEFRKEHGFDEFNQETFLRKPIDTKDLVYEINKLLESS